MATVTKDLGIATAYGYAKSKGYTGTEDEFAQAMLDMTTAVDDAQQYAQDAEDAKDDAQASAESIEQSAQQIATNTSDIADLKEDLSDMSTNGIVPTSRQLLSDKYVVDQTPYKFRASYSGDRMDDEIVGGSIVWNQLVQNGDFADTSIWTKQGSGQFAVDNNVGALNISGAAIYLSQVINIPISHVCLMSADLKSSTDRVLRFSFGGNEIVSVHTANTSWTTFTKVHKKTSDSTNANFVRATDGLESGDVINIKNAQLFDLTAMFGAEVADAVYAMEQAEAGAGVAWFKNLFPNDYYEYSEPTLKHVEGLQKHEMVGFNLFDRSRASENIALMWATGEERTEVGSIASPYMRVKGGERYYSNYKAGWLIYDGEFNYLGAWRVPDGWQKMSGSSANTTTLPNDAVYLRLALRASMNGNIDMTKVSDICINLSDAPRNGTYEPYVKHSYPLDNSLTLRGIPKIDVGGNLYYDGDTYESDGTVTRKYGIVDLGTLSWEYLANTFGGAFRAYLTQAVPNKIILLCEKYVNVNTSAEITNSDKVIYSRNNGVAICIKDTTYTDTATFKASLSGVMLVYELAESTTETAQPYTALQTVDASGTEEYVSTSIVPVGHYTKYYDDLRKKLDGLPWDLSMIAPIETGTTASQAYAVGKYFLLNHQLCKAKTAIASGATFTLNTNYEVTTVADELYTALQA